MKFVYWQLNKMRDGRVGNPKQWLQRTTPYSERMYNCICQYYEDFAQEGMIGLIKAARTFDPSYGWKFLTYASRCIMNEFLMFYRRLNKHYYEDVYSLDAEMYGPEGNLTLGDIVEDKTDFFGPIFNSLDLQAFHKWLETQPPKHKAVIKGRLEDKTQKQISIELDISQSYLSRIEKRVISNYIKVLAGKEAKYTGRL